MENIYVRILSRKNGPQNLEKNGRFEGGGYLQNFFADRVLKGGVLTGGGVFTVIRADGDFIEFEL